MGSYLSAPITEKETEKGVTSAAKFEWAVGSMQGWRKSQEDAHIACDLPNNTAVFGVFDGHGGREVSNFVKTRFAPAVEARPEFASDLGATLRGAFHGMDELLEDKSNLPVLQELKAVPTTLTQGGGAGGAAGGGGDGADGDGEGQGEGQRERAVSVEEAVEVFQKLLTLKRMAANANAPGGATAAGGGGASGGEEDDSAQAEAGPPAGGSPLQLMSGGGGRMCTLPPSHVEAGCTAVVAAVRDGVLTVANAGDSRAVLCRGGEALPLSEDHKPAQARELARIEAAGGFVTPQGRVNGNLNLSRALGDLKYKGNTAVARAEQMITAEPDVKVVRLEASDEFLLLACDGVWDVMTSQQCVDFVRERIAKGMALEEIVSEIFDACISEDPKTTGGLGGDNMTAIIVRLKQ